MKYFLLFLLSLSLCLNHATAQINQTDSLELVRFYNHNCNEGCALNWDLSQPINTWQGVGLVSRRVVKLSCRDAGLSDTLLNLNLSQLQRLSLDNNQLAGNIPNFNYLPQLAYLNLSSNQLSGNIPQFNHLSKLTFLHLEYNQLSGNIPQFNYLSKLTFLFLEHNQFTFEHILPSYSSIIRRSMAYIYASQDSIAIPTSMTVVKHGSSHTINLAIDDTVTTNTYYWYKDGIVIDSTFGINKYTIHNFQANNAGSYTVKVTNSIATNTNHPLVLHSKPITLSMANSTSSRLTDSLELVHFYNHSCNKGCKLNWDFTQPINTWQGVGLVDRRVVELSCRNVGLSGALLDLDLPKLKRLDLCRNQLSGNIPNFNYLPKLIELDLSHNQLSGKTPDFSNLLIKKL